MRRLELTDDLSLVLGGDTNIGAVRELVGDEGHPANSGNTQNANNGVCGDIREPSLGERFVFLHLASNGRQVHATGSESHVGSTVVNKEDSVCEL